MEKCYDLVALGEGMIEFNQIDPAQPHYRQGFGGDTSNVVIAASRQGARTAFLSRVGDDAFGRLLLNLWREESVDCRAVAVDSAAPTGVYFVTHDANGHAFSYLRSGSAASRMTPDNCVLDACAQSAWLHVSGISQAISASACDTVFAAMASARASDTQVSFDPNLRLRLWPLARAKAIIEATIGMTDLFLPSLDEVQTIAGADTVPDIFAWCFAHGARAVVLKAGAQGAWLAQRGQAPQRVPGLPVQAIDATGAGDCFDGSLLARLAAGDALHVAVRYANVAAALSTQGLGAVAPIPRGTDVLARL